MQCGPATDCDENLFGNPNTHECVKGDFCPTGLYSNPATKICEACPSGSSYVTVDHSSCISDKKNCGLGSSVLSSDNQCKYCKIAVPSTPFASLDHSSCVIAMGCETDSYGNQNNFQCVAAEECPDDYVGNSSTKLCQKCASNQFVSVSHLACLNFLEDCGNGSSVVYGSQCKICIDYDPSSPFANVCHNACVPYYQCESGYYANMETNQCEACPIGTVVSVDHLECLASKFDCGNGASLLNGTQCTNCES